MTQQSTKCDCIHHNGASNIYLPTRLDRHIVIDPIPPDMFDRPKLGYEINYANPHPIFYMTADGIRQYELQGADTIHVPLLERPINDIDIADCLLQAAKASKHVVGDYMDYVYCHVVSSKNTPFDNNIPKAIGSWPQLENIKLDMWPDNFYAYLPDPEFLGCLALGQNNHALFILTEGICTYTKVE